MKPNNPTKPVRSDPDTGYVCLSDIIRKYPEGKYIFSNWLSDPNTISFFCAWETLHNPAFILEDFNWILHESGSNTFILTPEALIESGATGLYLRQARWPLIYGHLDWAVHFGNWLSPAFYVSTLAQLRQHDKFLHQRTQKTIARFSMLHPE